MHSKTTGKDNSIKKRVAGAVPKKMIIGGMVDRSLEKIMVNTEVGQECRSVLVLIIHIKVSSKED